MPDNGNVGANNNCSVLHVHSEVEIRVLERFEDSSLHLSSVDDSASCDRVSELVRLPKSLRHLVLQLGLPYHQATQLQRDGVRSFLLDVQD